MFLPVTLLLELLALFATTARSAPQVVLASDKAWTLAGNTTTVTRSQLSRFCSPQAGHEQDPAIIASPQDNAGIKQVTLRFTGATAIIYGSVLTGDPINDPITIDFEDDHASQEPVNWREGGLPKSSIDPVTGAACDVVLATIDYDPGSHSVSISVVDQRIAIYNTSIFATNILAETPSSSIDSLPSSTFPASSAESSEQVSSASLSFSVTVSVTAPTGTITLGTTGQERHGHPVATRTIAIVLACILIPLALLFVVCVWYKLRRRRRACDSTLQPYPGQSSRSRSSHDSPRMEKVSPNGTDAPSVAAETALSSYRAEGRSKWTRPRREAADEALSTPRPLDSAVTDDVATADPAQIIAIQRAVRQAGFSTQALLDSLNRVHRRSNPTSPDDATSAAAPPHYDG